MVQQVKDLVAAAQITAVVQVQPLTWNFHMPWEWPKKKQKKKPEQYLTIEHLHKIQ